VLEPAAFGGRGPERTLIAWLRQTRTSRAPSASARPADAPLPGRADRTLHRIRTVLVTALAGLVAVIALLAFVASFDKISAYAVTQVAWPSRLRWIPPMLVDSFTFVGTLLVVWLSLSPAPRRKATAYGWLLVTTGTAASVIVNVEHAPTTLAGRIIAGSPPVALLLAIEALVIVLRYLLSDLAATARTQTSRPVVPSVYAPATRTADDRPGLGASSFKLHSLPAEQREPANATAEDTPTSGDMPSRALRARVEAIWQAREQNGGQPLVGAELAREFGTPARHVQAVLRDLRRRAGEQAMKDGNS
jgi:hypothetical protein